MLLNCVSIRAVAALMVIPVAGFLSDQFGRKRIIAVGCVGTGLWMFALFGLMNTTVVGLIILGLVVDGIFQDLQYGPQAAVIAENFPGIAPVYRLGPRLSPGRDYRGRPRTNRCILSLRDLSDVNGHCPCGVWPGHDCDSARDASGAAQSAPGEHSMTGNQPRALPLISLQSPRLVASVSCALRAPRTAMRVTMIEIHATSRIAVQGREESRR